jgi:hypothetical protein
MEAITKKEKETIEKFEKLNGIKKDQDFLFALQQDEGAQVLARLDDEFVYQLITGLFMDHPQIAEMIINDLIHAIEQGIAKTIKATKTIKTTKENKNLH